MVRCEVGNQNKAATVAGGTVAGGDVTVPSILQRSLRVIMITWCLEINTFDQYLNRFDESRSSFLWHLVDFFISGQT